MKAFYFILLCISSSAFAQIQLSEKAAISLITAGPGNTELYEAFGHTTIRISDPLHTFDFAYNYGIFDLNGEDFYLNFVKGNMYYKLAKYPFYQFVYGYKQDKRWIVEQVLNLTQQEKQHFFDYLENNAKPENASYFYDPYFNNCATVIRDITKTVLGTTITFNSNNYKETTLRTIMDKELPWNTWGSFGIDFALGSILDRKAIFEETMYLPDHLSVAFQNATITRNNKQVPLVKQERSILNFEELQQKIPFFNPLLTFSLFLLFVVIITYKNYKTKKRSKWLDFILFFSTGVLGVLIIFLWFFTNHSTAIKNYNFLWAFAPNSVVAFFLIKTHTKQWVFKYAFYLILLIIMLFVVWIFKVQAFSYALIPLLLALLIRYFYLWKLAR